VFGVIVQHSSTQVTIVK